MVAGFGLSVVDVVVGVAAFPKSEPAGVAAGLANPLKKEGAAAITDINSLYNLYRTVLTGSPGGGFGGFACVTE